MTLSSGRENSTSGRFVQQSSFDLETVWLAVPLGKQGRSATFKPLFGLPVRQTTGLVASLLELAGLEWPEPDFSRRCRCHKDLNGDIPTGPTPARCNR